MTTTHASAPAAFYLRRVIHLAAVIDGAPADHALCGMNLQYGAIDTTADATCSECLTIAERLASATPAVEPAERIAAEVAESEVPEYLRPALDAYGAAIAAHGQTYGDSPACECGAPFRTRRGVGLHVTAAHKRAEREYTAAAAIAANRHNPTALQAAARTSEPVVQPETDPAAEYRHNYAAGYRTGQTSAGLDRADADGRTARPGWTAGYEDAAAGRPRRPVAEPEPVVETPALTAGAVTRVLRGVPGGDLFSSRLESSIGVVRVSQRYAVRGALASADLSSRREARARAGEEALVAAGYKVEREFDRLTVTLPEPVQITSRQALVDRLIAGGMGAERAEEVADARDALQAELTASAPAIAAAIEEPLRPSDAYAENLPGSSYRHDPVVELETITNRRELLDAVESEYRRLGYRNPAHLLQAPGREVVRARAEVAAYAPDGAPMPAGVGGCDCSAVPGPHLAHCDDCSAPLDVCACPPAPVHYTRAQIVERFREVDEFVLDLGPDDRAYDPETGDTLLGGVRVRYARGTFPGPTYTATILDRDEPGPEVDEPREQPEPLDWSAIAAQIDAARR